MLKPAYRGLAVLDPVWKIRLRHFRFSVSEDKNAATDEDLTTNPVKSPTNDKFVLNLRQLDLTDHEDELVNGL